GFTHLCGWAREVDSGEFAEIRGSGLGRVLVYALLHHRSVKGREPTMLSKRTAILLVTAGLVVAISLSACRSGPAPAAEGKPGYYSGPMTPAHKGGSD